MDELPEFDGLDEIAALVDAEDEQITGARQRLVRHTVALFEDACAAGLVEGAAWELARLWFEEQVRGSMQVEVGLRLRGRK